MIDLVLQARVDICWVPVYPVRDAQTNMPVAVDRTPPLYLREWNSVYSRKVIVSPDDQPKASVDVVAFQGLTATSTDVDPTLPPGASGGNIAVVASVGPGEGLECLQAAAPTDNSRAQPPSFCATWENPAASDGTASTASTQEHNLAILPAECRSTSSRPANKIARIDNRVGSLSDSGDVPASAVVVIPPDICSRFRIRVSSICTRSKERMSIGITQLENYRTWEDTGASASSFRGRFFGGGAPTHYSESGLWTLGMVLQPGFNPRYYIWDR